jgi:hypothetical protein
MEFLIEPKKLSGGEISLMTYTEVKSLYKNELFEYFEERARIEDRD